MTTPLDILIIGGGIGGQTLALALHATGMPCRIRVHEAAPTLMPLGVGINLQPHAIRELAGLGLLDDLARVGIEAKEFAYFTHHGQLVYREPSGLFAGYKFPHFSIHRGELLMVLYAAAKARIGAESIVTGQRCTAVEQDAAGAIAHFVDAQGRSLPSQRADIIIACDGIHSCVRKQFYPDEGAPVFHGINLWRGLTRAKPFLTGASVTRVGGLHTTSKLVIYPIRNNIDVDGNQLLNWNTEVVSEQHAALDWNAPGRLEDFYPIFKDWSFDWLDCADVMRRADLLLTYPMVDRDPVARWSFGRITLLGDAAHPMYPRGGNGGAQAIIDATTLAALIAASDNPVAALASYEEKRVPVTSRIVLENRTAPPDIIIDTVERLTGGQRFDDLSRFISQDELRQMAQRYYRVAGSDLDSVGRQGG